MPPNDASRTIPNPTAFQGTSDIPSLMLCDRFSSSPEKTRRRFARLLPAHLYSTFRFEAIFPSEEQLFFMPKRTFQPNRRHRSKTHGFRTRMKTKAGRAVISRRRSKGRKRVSVKPGFRE